MKIKEIWIGVCSVYLGLVKFIYTYIYICQRSFYMYRNLWMKKVVIDLTFVFFQIHIFECNLQCDGIYIGDFGYV